MINEKALFIGPKGENQDFFSKNLSNIFNDYIHWRRNFHSNDNPLITESDKRDTVFIETQDTIVQKLDSLLNEMRQSVPYHSPRLLGHMHSDLAIPALLGYFTGFLYNQNNVVGESSPISTRKEIEFISKMCKMIGYKNFGISQSNNTILSWGHLCSGGTSANIEAVWVARNLKYYPVSIKLMTLNSKKLSATQKNLLDNVKIQGIGRLKDISFSNLFNLSQEQILELRKNCFDVLFDKNNESSSKTFTYALHEFDVRNLGVAGIHIELHKLNQPLDLPLLYISTAAHYSWDKCLDIIGIGSNNVVRVNVDSDFEMCMKDLETKVFENRNKSILMVVGVVGTTEEGAIDPIKKIQDFKINSDNNFFFHIDAAYGGYFSALIHDTENSQYNEVFDKKYSSFIDDIKEDLIALKHADSITIDPHKLGYVPYSAGSIFYKDTRYKDFIFKNAPYLAEAKEKDAIERTYLGGWTLEGSRAGATALACALSVDVIALDKSGYGKLLANTIQQTNLLYEKFANNLDDDFKIIPIYKPKTNIICFYIAAPQYIKNIDHANLITNAIMAEMSVKPDRPLDINSFVSSQTGLQYGKYRNILDPILKEAGIINSNIPDNFELDFLRTVVMHPMIENYEVNIWEDNQNKKAPLFDVFTNELLKVAKIALPKILLEILKTNKSKNESFSRVKILWIENKDSYREHQSALQLEQIDTLPEIGKYLDITFYDYKTLIDGECGINGLKNLIKDKEFNCSIIDLNLADSEHTEDASGREVIDFLYPDRTYNKNGIPILYSKFFNDNSNRESIIASFQTFGKLFSNKEFQFVSKYKSSENENEIEMEKKSIGELIKSIYQAMHYQ